jgi:hypothetical protein
MMSGPVRCLLLLLRPKHKLPLKLWLLPPNPTPKQWGRVYSAKSALARRAHRAELLALPMA